MKPELCPDCGKPLTREADGTEWCFSCTPIVWKEDEYKVEVAEEE